MVKMVELPVLDRLAYSSRLYFFEADKPLKVSVRSVLEEVVYRSTSGGAMVPP
jgi:hypothetical protein